jgi:hypothetical protein
MCSGLKIQDEPKTIINSYDVISSKIEDACRESGICHVEVEKMALQWDLMMSKAWSGTQALSTDHDWYEFGVYTGKGLGEKMRWLKQHKASGPRHLWAFDSWEGLPESSEDNPSKQWLDVSKDMGHEWESKKKMVLANIDYADTTLIKGFYNESLTNDLIQTHGMKQAWWVNIDCDIYISTYQALDWMFKSKLMRPGTKVYYDDVLIYPTDTAEKKAHDEITEKYGVVWKERLRHNHFFSPDQQVTYFYEVESYKDM